MKKFLIWSIVIWISCVNNWYQSWNRNRFEEDLSNFLEFFESFWKSQYLIDFGVLDQIDWWFVFRLLRFWSRIELNQSISKFGSKLVKICEIFEIFGFFEKVSVYDSKVCEKVVFRQNFLLQSCSEHDFEWICKFSEHLDHFWVRYRGLKISGSRIQAGRIDLQTGRTGQSSNWSDKAIFKLVGQDCSSEKNTVHPSKYCSSEQTLFIMLLYPISIA